MTIGVVYSRVIIEALPVPVLVLLIDNNCAKAKTFPLHAAALKEIILARAKPKYIMFLDYPLTTISLDVVFEYIQLGLLSNKFLYIQTHLC